MKLIIGFFTAISLFIGFANAAVEITDNNGILQGYKDLDVNGTKYKVSFVDGNCSEVFGVCEASSFQFQNLPDASSATDALLGAISGTSFNDNPETINGCENEDNEEQCLFYTPYGIFNDNGTPSINLVAGQTDGTTNNTSNFGDLIISIADSQLSDVTDVVWAKWILDFDNGFINILPKRIKTRSKKPIAVAILGSQELNVMNIDVSSLMLGTAPVKKKESYLKISIKIISRT